MPAAHQGILQVPVLGMQYANDLEWLAQQLCELCRHSVLFSTYPAIIEEAQQIGRNLLGQSKGQRDHQIVRRSLSSSVNATLIQLVICSPRKEYPSWKAYKTPITLI